MWKANQGRRHSEPGTRCRLHGTNNVHQCYAKKESHGCAEEKREEDLAKAGRNGKTKGFPGRNPGKLASIYKRCRSRNVKDNVT